MDAKYDSAVELGREWFKDQELYHYGVPDQKWGVRRYQDENGRLTALGRIRYGVGKAGKAIGSGAAKAGKAIGKAAKAGVEKHKAKVVAKKESKRIEELMKKPLHKLTNEELAERTKRAEAEKKLYETEDKYAHKVKSAMSKFGKDFWDKAVVPAATEAGKDIIKNVLKKTADKVLNVNTSELFRLVEEGGDLSKFTNDDISDASKRATNINTIRQQLAQARNAGSGNQRDNQQKPKDNKPKDDKPKDNKPDDGKPKTETESKPKDEKPKTETPTLKPPEPLTTPTRSKGKKSKNKSKASSGSDTPKIDTTLPVTAATSVPAVINRGAQWVKDNFDTYTERDEFDT